MRHLLCWALLLSLLHAAEPVGYYAPAAGLTGPSLRLALHDIIRAHAVIPYSSSSFDTQNAMEVLDEDPTNSANVLLIYAATSRAKSLFGTGTGKWDREHLWPNSYGIDDTHPMYSDLFNLRPCDSNTNSDRSNNYFDESTPGASGYESPAHVNAPQCSEMSGLSWEPPMDRKGDIARSLFYMDVRYDGSDGEIDLQLTDNTALINSSSAYMGRLSTLLVWHFLDPVDDAERSRNDKIFMLYQHNRNPFIDHPEWVEAIFGPVFQIAIMSSSTGTVTVSWPAAPPDGMWEIQSSSNLTGWNALAPMIFTENGWRKTHLISTTLPQFYRLVLRAKNG